MDGNRKDPFSPIDNQSDQAFSHPGQTPSSPFESSGFVPPNKPRNDYAEQGATYEEVDHDVFDSSGGMVGSDIDGVMLENESAMSVLGKNKLLVLAAVGVFVLVIIIAIIFMVSGNKDSTEPVSDILTGDTGVNATVDGDGFFVPDFGGGTEEPYIEEPVVPDIQDSFLVIYTDDVLEELRSYGFTSTEIDDFQIEGREDVEDIIKEAKLAIQARILEQYAYLQDQYMARLPRDEKEFYKNSWYSLPALILSDPVYDEFEHEAPPEIYETTDNVNYEKIPLLGHQSWLKLTMGDGSIAFMEVDPWRYMELEKEAGNIVVSYTMTTYREGIFYLNITEVPIG